MFLKPSKSKTAGKYNVLDIFCIIDTPFILHHSKEREFMTSVIKELGAIFKAKIIYEKLWHLTLAVSREHRLCQ